MSTIGQCNTPCPVPVPVNIPGPAGATAYTFTTAQITVPAIGATVTVPVLDTSWMETGLTVVLPGPAHFTVTTINSGSSVTLTFTGTPGDVVPGSTISSGSLVVPTGQPGQPGYTLTTSTPFFTVPSVGNTVAITVQSTAPFVQGQNIIISGPANFLVTAITSSTGMTIQALGYTGDVAAGTHINVGATVTTAGTAGVNAYTKTTAQFTIPALNTNVTVSVLNTSWMAIGQKVVASGPATFAVATINSGTSVTLTYLGYFGDLTAGNTIANNSTVSPAGSEPPPGSALAVYASGTPYVLTASFALLALGTNTPSLVLNAAGTWVLFARAAFDFPNVITPVEATLSLKLTRTNNSAADITNSLTNIITGIGEFYGGQSITTPPVIYTTANTNDIIQLWGMNTDITSGGVVNEACIVAINIA